MALNNGNLKNKPMATKNSNESRPNLFSNLIRIQVLALLSMTTGMVAAFVYVSVYAGKNIDELSKLKFFIDSSADINKSNLILIAAPILMFYIGRLLFEFLRSDNDEVITKGRINNMIDDKLRDIELIVSSITAAQSKENVVNSEYSFKAAINAVEEKIFSESARDIISKIRDEIRIQSKIDIVKDIFELSIARLVSERNRLGARGNLNLGFGIFISISGMVFMLYTVAQLHSKTNINDVGSYVKYMVPNISLVVLVEVFAYFFLKLYKQSLSEIKYFQNEITNIESRLISVVLALTHDKSSILDDLSVKLISVERNFIIEKGQSTIELEREKLDVTQVNGVISTLRAMLNSKDVK